MHLLEHLQQLVWDQKVKCKVAVTGVKAAAHITAATNWLSVYLVNVDLVALDRLLGTSLPATSALLGDRLLGWLCRLLFA